MKGLILTGGMGTRLRPITYTGAKQLVPIANKPLLFYAIEAIQGAGIEEIGFVVGHTAPEIKEAVGDGSRWGMRAMYIQQEAPLGLAHAVKISREYIGGEPFVMYLGDNFLLGGIVSLVREFENTGANAQILLTEVEHPENFGVAELEGERVIRLVEKPKHPRTNLALVGIYMFDAHIFEAVDVICSRPPSWRGEYEITDAIQYLIDREYTIRWHLIRGWWKDTGSKEDMLEANRMMLDTIESRCEGTVDEVSRIIGRVIVEEGAMVSNSVIRGPAIVGKRTRIVRSFVGPYTSIHDDVVIENSEVEYSIILTNSRIQNIEGRINDSLIGRDVEVSRGDSRPRALSFMLGDSSRVSLL